jgi:hypothetical protein
MTAPNGAADTLAVVRYNQDAIAEITQCVQDGVYCALLGPRLSGKTELLRYVANMLAESQLQTCIYIDLYAIQASTLQRFFADLIRLTAEGIREKRGLDLQVPKPNVASSAVFRGFLLDSLNHTASDIILIIEHLEAVPTDLVQALLTSLRAAYMDQLSEEYRVVVVVSGALSLATLTVGESSPFRGIARRLFIGDLTRPQSERLIAEELAAAGVGLSKRARKRLLRATSGDPFLIRRLCQLCTDAVQQSETQHLWATDVKSVIREFLRDEVYRYAPLQEAVWLIEEDPDLLRCILLLLAHGTVLKSDLPLPLSPDLDPLYLTGVVEQVDEDSYRLQNRIYHRFLAKHLKPGHVGHLLTMAGRWDSAIDYLEAGVGAGERHARSDLLSATINSMYASEDVHQAAHFLTRGLSASFGLAEARVWYAPPQEDRLRLVGFLGPRASDRPWTTSEMSIKADRLEARAFRQARAVRGPEGGRLVWRAIPLLIPGRKPIGVVTLCDDLQGSRHVAQRERDLQLTGYLNQAARAVRAVCTRRKELELAGRMQASLLPENSPDIDGWQLAASLWPARETSGDFYDFIPLPNGKLGIVIADVADKGMGAALYMALSRTLIRTYATDFPDRPDLALNAANARILADTQADLFVTVFYGILDPSSGALTYCNAGHHPPYLLDPNAPDPVRAVPGRGLALGVIEDTKWTHSTLRIPSGTLLLMYTDGVVDALNPLGERFGAEKMLDIAQQNSGCSARELRDDLLTHLQHFIGDKPQFDDITLVAVERAARHQ